MAKTETDTETDDRPSTRYENILVPTDGSEGARRGVEHALDIGSQYGAKIHVMHVIDERTHSGTPALSSEELVLDKIEEEARDVVDDIVTDAERVGLETITCLCRGVPASEITEYATANDIDLIVMGIHGAEKEGRPHVGSTTHRVLRTSPVPVLPV